MFKDNDNFIVFFIKFAPIIFVIILSIITTQIVLYEKEKEFQNETKELTKEYYQSNKKRVKEEISRVYSFIKTEQQKRLNLKKSLKNSVNQAYNLSLNIYNKYKDEKSKEEILEIIKTALSSLKFNQNENYFFILNEKGNFLLQPFIDKVAKNFDKNVLENMITTLENKSQRFDSYKWYKNKNLDKQFEKISFYKYFEPFNIIIGTGKYLQDFEEQLKEKILERIQKIRYNQNAYIFVIDYEGNYLAHYNKDFIGKNRLDYKNNEGKYLVKDIIEFAKKNSGKYMTYTATLNTHKGIYSNKKISYIIGLDEYKWSIGTGFYTEALNKKIQQKKERLERKKEESVDKIIKLSILLTLLLLVISFLISKALEIRLRNYKKEIEAKVLENEEKDYILYQQSKMATMGEMISNIAHQWRQPLSQISTISSGIKMQKELNSLDITTIDKNMDNITKSVQYLSTTIDDFRDFFSPDKKTKIFYLEQTIEKTLKLVESQFKTHNIKIIKNIDSVQINNYENELLQVLINLLKNSLDALLEYKPQSEKLIFITTKLHEKNVSISITDNAGGISEEIIDNIFEPYFTTKDNKGTGIGLYMSKKIIVQSMNGKVEVKNSEYEYNKKIQKGASFNILLPLEV